MAKKMSKMRKLALIVCAGILGLVILVGGLYFNQVRKGKALLAQSPHEPWTLQQALDRARQDDKLVLADVSALWCPNCQKLNREVLSEPAVVAAMTPEFVYTRIEFGSPEGQKMRETYQVKAFPTLLILDGTGRQLGTLEVSFDPQVFRKQLEAMSRQHLDHPNG